MKVIWKYHLQVTDEQIINVPEGAVALTVQMQDNTPWLWMLVDPTTPRVPRKIITCGTGNPISEVPGEYIGTYQMFGGTLVFHVFAAAAWNVRNHEDQPLN